MIDKGLSYEQMMELLKVKTDSLLALKSGIVIMFFGFGLGLGFLFKNWTWNDEWMGFTIITMTGIGFVVAYFIARKVRNENGKQQ